MDITIEGFHSWMWKGLTFLLPFLFGGYLFQAYNSYQLYQISKLPDAPWQISLLSVLFLALFIGNTWTTLMVVPQKLRGKLKEGYRLKSMSYALKIRQQIRVSRWLLFWRFSLKNLFRAREFDRVNHTMIITWMMALPRTNRSTHTQHSMTIFSWITLKCTERARSNKIWEKTCT